METLDQLVRRIDEDRWLASRFADEVVRKRLIAIYAVNYEIARTPETVTQGAIGDIRLAWWREALSEIHAGKPSRAHPALQAYASAAREVALPLNVWEGLLEARGKDLDAAPFATVTDLDGYLQATSGGVMRLALAACRAEVSEAVVDAAARAWGRAGLLRSEDHWRARGRSFLPPGMRREAFIDGAAAAHLEAQAQSTSAESFAALGYVALVPSYLRALRKGRSDEPLLARQLRLIAASATGQL